MENVEQSSKGFPKQSIKQFLGAFEHTGSPNEVSPNKVNSVASQFVDTFLVAGPDGSMVVQASDFAQALPRRRKMFDEWGCRSTKLDSLVETRLDSRYVMAETKWRMSFSHGDGESSDVVVGSTYILDTKDELKIVLYLTHQDIASVLREWGILRS
jgi:hypothetical protein